MITLTRRNVRYCFCSKPCKIDFTNNVERTANADANLYGCFQCGADLVGLNLAGLERNDRNIYKLKREERK